MALIKGRGGVTFTTFDDTFSVVELVPLEVAEWTLRTSALDHDLTTAGVRGSRGGVLGTMTDWTVALPMDSEVLPQEAGLIAGQAVEVWFEIADLGVWHRLTNSLILFVSETNSSMGDLYRLVIQGRYGTMYEYSSPPALPGPPTPPAVPLPGTSSLGGYGAPSYPPSLGGL